tara:strand:- start:1661 stop:1915 length:255 start_codon:yes stop_codon:yes gene_type:complete
MENYFEDIKKKIQDEIELEELKIIDNSQNHKNHKFFNKNKYHLKLEIKSNFLRSISYLDAQRKIMNILKDDLKQKIHALVIEIK